LVFGVCAPSYGDYDSRALRYVLENIEQQVTDAIVSAGSVGSIDAKELESISQECGRVKRFLKKKVLAVKSEKLICRCFSFHQKALIRLIDECTFARRDRSSAKCLVDVERQLMDLLTFLEQRFLSYFDQDLNLPQNLKGAIENEVNQTVQSISSKYLKTSLDEQLLRIVLTSVSNLANTWGELSYRKLYFVRILKTRLLAIDSPMDNPDIFRQDFCRELIRTNFNADEFFGYYTRHITATLSACETLSDRIEQVYYFYKICGQEHCVQNIAFVAGSPSINDRLGEWISQEIEYLNIKRQLRLTAGEKNEGLLNDFKLDFDLSVPQLAYLFRAFIETGVIRNKNTSELVRFLSKFVKTKKAEVISYDSFRIKFYNVESGTKDAVKRMLQAMLQYMNKN
jgi:hypothetical protein